MDSGQWAVGGEEGAGVATREGGPTPPPEPVRLALVFALVVLLVTLPIFAHGCHTGDHDDEPLFAPPDHHVAKAELPQK